MQSTTAICPSLFNATTAQDGILSRIRLPAGLITASQCQLISEIVNQFGTNQFGYGEVQITNRANLQIRTSAALSENTLLDLQDYGLASSCPDTDGLRNIMASPAAGIDSQALVNTIPLVKQWNFYLLNHPELAILSNKFSVCFDGGESINISDRPNDICFKALAIKDEIYFSLQLGSEVVGILIPYSQVIAVIAALTEVYRDYTEQKVEQKIEQKLEQDSKNLRSRPPRLRELLNDWGIDKYLDLVAEKLTSRSPSIPLKKGDEEISTPPFTRGAGGDLNPESQMERSPSIPLKKGEEEISTPPFTRGAGGDQHLESQMERSPSISLKKGEEENSPPFTRGAGGDQHLESQMEKSPSIPLKKGEEGISTPPFTRGAGGDQHPEPQIERPSPLAPLPFWERGTRGYQHLGIHPQKQSGLAYIGIVVPLGRLTAQQLRGLAELAKQYGGGALRLTPWQNILLTDIAIADLAKVTELIANLGLSISPTHPYAAIAACSGITGCKSAHTDTQQDAKAIASHLEKCMQLDEPINFHFSGCDKSCAQHHASDIAIVGQDSRTYKIYIGDGEIHFGRELYAECMANELPQLMERLINVYQTQRQPNQNFREFVNQSDLPELNRKLRQGAIGHA